MKTLNIAAFALNAALYVAAGILFYSALPISFGPVRFWPQAVIPAVFAVVFGPWVGGLGAALGIFVNDLVLNNNPLLSLMAGVTANFAAFWLVGYIANKKTGWMQSVVAYSAITGLLLAIGYFFTEIIYVGIIATSYVIFLLIVALARKWRAYELASAIGLLVGSAIIGLMVPVYFQYFAPNSTPITLGSGLAYLIWTFTTEIPFLLALGPPIIEVIFHAFPNLVVREKTKE